MKISDERRNQLAEMLEKDNVPSYIVDKMTDDELEQSAGYDDYAEYNHFMKYMFFKYDR